MTSTTRVQGEGPRVERDTRRVLFLGGNGHSGARLAPARAALAMHEVPLELVDAPYPGFEGRPRARDWNEFLDAVNESARCSAPDLVYATGIGGLIALALRARGDLGDVPIVMQGCVLWGLEHRKFARAMRGPLPHLLRLALRTPLARARFRAKHLPAGLHPRTEREFFQGYASCAAFPDFFRWMRAPLLRRLEEVFRAHPERLARITAWWGTRDRVVGLDELEVTERALGVRFPRVVFEEWDHYPMLGRPREWTEALDRALA